MKQTTYVPIKARHDAREAGRIKHLATQARIDALPRRRYLKVGYGASQPKSRDGWMAVTAHRVPIDCNAGRPGQHLCDLLSDDPAEGWENEKGWGGMRHLGLYPSWFIHGQILEITKPGGTGDWDCRCYVEALVECTDAYAQNHARWLTPVEEEPA